MDLIMYHYMFTVFMNSFVGQVDTKSVVRIFKSRVVYKKNQRVKFRFLHLSKNWCLIFASAPKTCKRVKKR